MQKKIPKSIYFFGLIVFLGAAALYAHSLLPYAKLTPSPNYLTLPPQKNTAARLNPRMRIGRIEIPVEVVKTSAEIQKGLSGRKYLDLESGLLFIFAKPDLYRFWMPDMHFPIDIIWINDKKVVGIEENVSNEFNPAHPKFYTPPQPVQHVLEVNAQFAKNKKIRIGDPVIFNYIE
mgnify:FL=1